MRWRCSASTPSTGWWCRAWSPRPSSPLLLNGAVITIGLVGGFVFGVYHPTCFGRRVCRHADPGHRLAGGADLGGQGHDFGLIAGLVGCYRGLTTKGGPKGVGTAVNETLVLCVIALFAVNVVLTTIGVRFGTGR